MTSRKKAQIKKLEGAELSDKEKAKVSVSRNPVIQSVVEQGGNSGAGAHKDKRREAKLGKSKHKRRNFGY